MIAAATAKSESKSAATGANGDGAIAAISDGPPAMSSPMPSALADRAAATSTSARDASSAALPSARTVADLDADPLDRWLPGKTPVRVDRARLVVGDDGDRVVVAVALRHGTVDVAIRADDHHLAHALAATRDELDGALGRHGLALGDHAAGDRGGDARPRSQPARPDHASALDAAPVAPAADVVHDDPHLRARA